MNRNLQIPGLILLYFGLSILLTWSFVALSPHYISQDQMILSTIIAGAKWGLQILLAIIFLKGKRWEFIKNIGFVCFTGSLILIPYIILRIMHWANNAIYFWGSLVIAVLAMIMLYYRAVKLLGVSITYWFFWLLCLIIAISLQLTIVFHIIVF